MSETLHGEVEEVRGESRFEQLAGDIEAALSGTITEQAGYGEASRVAAESTLATALDFLRKGKPRLAQTLLEQRVQVLEATLISPSIKDEKRQEMMQQIETCKSLLQQF